jgi:NADPH:quinone reductase-like Zn-dependent oxidoreductase
MLVIIIKHFGGLDSLVIEELPNPVPQPGSVLIEVKAFGINHAETLGFPSHAPAGRTYVPSRMVGGS